MTWSLKLRHGDFTVSNAEFGTVINEDKLVQDLTCHLLEAMGTDDLHPGYGSLIDGGTRPDGIEVPSVIGESDVELVALEIESEIRRVAREHRAKQLNRAKEDRFVYNKVTLTPGEVLLAISNIDFVQIEDVLHVKVSLETATGQNLDILLPLPEEILAP